MASANNETQLKVRRFIRQQNINNTNTDVLTEYYSDEFVREKLSVFVLLMFLLLNKSTWHLELCLVIGWCHWEKNALQKDGIHVFPNEDLLYQVKQKSFQSEMFDEQSNE